MDRLLRTQLPAWAAVLAVVAHPDDESFGLGAVLAAFAAGGARVAVLCFTHGEASTLHGVAGDLHRLRAHELAAAAHVLGVATTVLRSYPDGGLPAVCQTQLTADVAAAARDGRSDGLVVFDPSGVTGHPDHVAATDAALVAADVLDLPVLGWTLPVAVAEALNRGRGTAFTGHPTDAVDYIIPVDRAVQLAAIAAHASQAVPASVLWQRLTRLGSVEHLRWLRRSVHVDTSRTALTSEGVIPR